jgi:hypothetical protein
VIGGLAGLFGGGGEDPAETARKQALGQQAAAAGGLADQTAQNYLGYGQQGQQALGWLQGQALGQNSVSALQLQQGIQQNIAAQQSMAAGAAARNQPMAARTAMINSMNLGSGLAGQQALAGLQERNQAQANYASLLQGLRGQDLNATLGSRQAAMTGYGAGATGAPAPTWMQQYGGAIGGLAGGISKIAGSGGSSSAGAPAGGYGSNNSWTGFGGT